MVMLNTAIQAIQNSDRDDLNQIIAAVKLRQTFLARKASRSFSVGDVVSFTGRRNNTVTGRVTKVNQKTVVVLDSNSSTQWKVTASMLTPLSIGV